MNLKSNIKELTYCLEKLKKETDLILNFCLASDFNKAITHTSVREKYIKLINYYTEEIITFCSNSHNINQEQQIEIKNILQKSSEDINNVILKDNTIHMYFKNASEQIQNELKKVKINHKGIKGYIISNNL